MSEETRDFVVLGSGPGGYVAAIRAAQLGRKVTIVEHEALGGVCLNWGCIPTKALLKSAQTYEELTHAKDLGFDVPSIGINFDRVMTRSREVAQKLSGGVSFLMKKNKVETLLGHGELLGGNRLQITDSKGQKREISYKDIIIAAGARARQLGDLEADGEVVHNYRTILDSKRHPKKLLVIGAGAIGIEFAYFFATLGTEVTVVEMMDHILPIEDNEVSTALKRSLEKRGIAIHVKTAVGGIKRSGKSITATLRPEGGTPVDWTGDACLVAIGVVGNTERIGLETAGVRVDRSFIVVDDYMRTSAPNHFAIGDVAGPPLLAHVASHEGIIAAEVACGVHAHAMNYENVPGCTYCQPQVASVGLTEQECKKRGLPYKVGKVPFAAIGKAIATNTSEGFIKVLISSDVGEVLGVHIIHAEATELISEAAIIRSHEGIAASVVDTVHPHPTLSEAIMEAMAAALGRPINT